MPSLALVLSLNGLLCVCAVSVQVASPLKGDDVFVSSLSGPG